MEIGFRSTEQAANLSDHNAVICEIMALQGSLQIHDTRKKSRIRIDMNDKKKIEIFQRTLNEWETSEDLN
jgi:hypothetical protein